MKKLLFIITILLLTINSDGQTWSWAKGGVGSGTNADEGWAISSDPTGNVLVTGEFQSPTITFGSFPLTTAGFNDVFLTKYDPNGNVLWAKSAGGSGGDWGYSVCTDLAGNVFITGFFGGPTMTFGSYTLTNSGTGINTFLAKYDPNGNPLWARNLMNFDNTGLGVSADPFGNVFVTGRFQSPTIVIGTNTLTSVGQYDIFLAKYDSNGNCLWARSAGGSLYDYGYSISSDLAGNVFIAGYYTSPTISFGTNTLTSAGGANDAFLAKYDSNGNVVWAKNAGGSGNDRVYSVSTSTNGSIFVAGSFDRSPITFGANSLSTTTGTKMFLAKYDTNGNDLWARTATGTSTNVAFSVSAYGGDIFVTGGLTNSLTTIGTFTFTPPASSPDAMFIAQYDMSGNAIYASYLTSGGDDVAPICVDKSCNAYISGDFMGTFVIGSNTLTPSSNENVFTAKFVYTCQPDNINSLTINDNNILFFPNPNNGSFKLQIDDEIKNGEMILFNSIGQAVHHQKIFQGTNEINTSGLSVGLYNYILLADKQKIKEGKLVVN